MAQFLYRCAAELRKAMQLALTHVLSQGGAGPEVWSSSPVSTPPVLCGIPIRSVKSTCHCRGHTAHSCFVQPARAFPILGSHPNGMFGDTFYVQALETPRLGAGLACLLQAEFQVGQQGTLVTPSLGKCEVGSAQWCSKTASSIQALHACVQEWVLDQANTINQAKIRCRQTAVCKRDESSGWGFLWFMFLLPNAYGYTNSWTLGTVDIRQVKENSAFDS
jgi:hypothetical protein